MGREIPLYTLSGVQDADISTHHFSTGDNLGLSLLRFHRRPSEDVVVIIHGLTTSSDMFIMPEHYNLVQYLLDHGLTDVWTVDFRMSNRYSSTTCFDTVTRWTISPSSISRRPSRRCASRSAIDGST